VLSRLAGHPDLPVMAMGLGAFLAREAARRLGLGCRELAEQCGSEAAAMAPSYAAAQLLAGLLEPGP
jgi:uncharacterized hydantoinase/oxoprolinase family protein